MNMLVSDDINDDKDWVYKIAVMGGKGVGKSNIIFRIVDKEFVKEYDPTIEDSYRKDDFDVDGSLVSVELLDTAGQVGFLICIIHFLL